MAKEVSIDIGNTAYKNIDEISTRDGISPSLVNGYKNDTGDDVKRPGLTLFSNLNIGSRVDGVFWCKELLKMFAVAGGNVYKISSGGTATQIGTGLLKNRKVRFNWSGSSLLMANGSNIYYTDGVTVTKVTDIAAPTVTNNAFYLSEYIVAGNETLLQFTDTFPTWSSLDSFGVNTMPDDILIADRNYDEIIVFGEDSIEGYSQTGGTTSPFEKYSGNFMESGLGSIDSLDKIERTIFYFLNKERIVKRLENRNPLTLSKVLEKEFNSYKVYSDSVGMFVKVSGKRFYILNFPTQNITWVYDIDLGFWYQWSQWDSVTATDKSFNVNCAATAWGKQFVGGLTDGKIYEIHADNYDDNGDMIRFSRRTGHIDHGTYRRKAGTELYIKTRRGLGNPNITDPQLMIQWRNDGKKFWGNEHWRSLGKLGEYEHIIKIRNTGLYRTRQYEFIHTEKTPFILTNPIKELVELR